MPSYTLNHVHHETANLEETVTFYKSFLGAEAGEPFVRGGANWIYVYVGDTQITVTDRECSDMKLERYQGYDHIAFNTDDWDATMAAIEKQGISVWFGPIELEEGGHTIFVEGPDNVKIELLASA